MGHEDAARPDDLQCEVSSSSARIRNGSVELRAGIDAGALSLSLCAVPRGAADAVPVLERVGENRADGPLCAELPEGAALSVHETSGSAIVVVRGCVGDAQLHVAIRLRRDSPWVEVSELLVCDAGGPQPEVERLEAVWRFVDWREPGEVFSPHLVPEPGDVIGRHVMRSPALTAQCGRRSASLVNDIDGIAHEQALPSCMNLLRENGTPVFRTGLMAHAVRGHVFFRATGEAASADRFHHSYRLRVSAEAPEGDAVNAAARHVWREWGARNLAGARPLPMAPEEYALAIYPPAFDALWAETELSGRRVGAICTNRSYPGDVWMCPWFSQVRSAYGLHLWGTWLGRDDWVGRARATRDLHLSSPQSRGLFPTVFVFGRDGAECRWVHSHHQGGGPGIYHLLDMSWTAYQLLRWHRDLERSEEAVDFARAYGNGLLDLLSEDGALPAYVDAHTFEPVDRVDVDRLVADLEEHPGGDGYVPHGVKTMWGSERFVGSGEDSASMLLFAELARALPSSDPDRDRFLRAARSIGRRIERDILTGALWTDFEVYFSCSSKPLSFNDGRSGQCPQNTLCMHTAAAGFLVLHELDGAQQDLDVARRVLSRMSLYQQAWDPSFLGCVALGGYGVMNTDGEWNDARQAQFADTHLDFFLITGDREQLERSQAATRAAFATVFHPAAGSWYPLGWSRTPEGMAAENHAHGGGDHLCGVSAFDWGSGSALASAAYLRLRGGAAGG